MSPWDEGPCRSRGFTMGTPLLVAPCRVLEAALALFLSPGVPDRHIVSAMINYRPDEMWSSGNVTRMTWACQCGTVGWSIYRTQTSGRIWRTSCIFKERTYYYLSWFLLDLMSFYNILSPAKSTSWVWISSVSILMTCNVNLIKVKWFTMQYQKMCFSPY